MIKEILKWWKNRNKKIGTYPYEFAIIKVSDIAKYSGTEDDENKIVDHYKGGKLIASYPYSESIVMTLRNIEEIPVVEEDFEIDEEFEWDESTEFGVTRAEI